MEQLIRHPQQLFGPKICCSYFITSKYYKCHRDLSLLWLPGIKNTEWIPETPSQKNFKAKIYSPRNFSHETSDQLLSGCGGGPLCHRKHTGNVLPAWPTLFHRSVILLSFCKGNLGILIMFFVFLNSKPSRIDSSPSLLEMSSIFNLGFY